MKHVWDVPRWQDQAACWCRPFVDQPDLPAPLAPLVFHRPDTGWLFRDLGEQGPFTELQDYQDAIAKQSEDEWVRVLVARFSRSHE